MLIIRGQAMKSVVVRVLIALVFMAALGAGQTSGADGPLPIKEGRYVLEGVPCDRGTTGDRLYYYAGDNNYYCIGIPHGECKIIQVYNKGNIYYVTLSCMARGVEGVFTDKKIISVKSTTSFSIYNYPYEQKKTKKKEQIFRWCDD
jgi:hypothetical protein